MKTIRQVFGKAFAFIIILTILCGGVYTFAATGIMQLIFPYQANGSISEVNGQKYSYLLGQEFTADNHLWGRIMNIDTGTYTDDNGNPVMYASPSNLSPASDEYKSLVAERVAAIRSAHPEKEGVPIPVDLVTCSGSGLDPHISPAAAYYQAERLARNTGKTVAEVQSIIDQYTEGRLFGIFGEPRVNVLKVNLALDGILQ